MNSMSTPNTPLPTERFWRQLDHLSPSLLTEPITIIGAGGTGSPTCMALAKMGCSNITVYDTDTVEDHNLPNQFYRLSDVGSLKVEALADIVASFTGVTITAKNERYIDQPLTGIVIVCVDNMQTRSDVWKKAYANIKVPLLIDARMGLETANIYAVNPCIMKQARAYEQTLHSDDDAALERCTAQAVMYCVFGVASIIGKIVATQAKREPLPLEGIAKIGDFATLSLY